MDRCCSAPEMEAEKIWSKRGAKGSEVWPGGRETALSGVYEGWAASATTLGLTCPLDARTSEQSVDRSAVHESHTNKIANCRGVEDQRECSDVRTN